MVYVHLLTYRTTKLVILLVHMALKSGETKNRKIEVSMLSKYPATLSSNRNTERVTLILPFHCVTLGEHTPRFILISASGLNGGINPRR